MVCLSSVSSAYVLCPALVLGSRCLLRKEGSQDRDGEESGSDWYLDGGYLAWTLFAKMMLIFKRLLCGREKKELSLY